MRSNYSKLVWHQKTCTDTYGSKTISMVFLRVLDFNFSPWILKSMYLSNNQGYCIISHRDIAHYLLNPLCLDCLHSAIQKFL